jgi:hypothetical protein
MSRMILLAVIAASGGDRYYATEEYCTRNADTPANTLFTGRLVDAVYERGVSFATWNRAGGAQAISYIDLINTDGGLDSWLAEDWRDVRITLKVVESLAAYSTATQVGVCVVDRLEAPDSNTVRFICRSVFERLEKVITTNYPDTITNESLREKPKPITLGRVRWLDPVNPRLNDSSGSTRGVWDVADGHFESIAELRARGALQTESQSPLVTNSSPQFFVSEDSFGYGFLLREQSNRLAAEVKGQVRLGDQMFSNSTFPSGTGGDPDGWAVIEGGTGTVTWDSAGSVTIVSDGTAATYIAQSQTTVTGALYRVELDITTQTGVINIQRSGTILRTVEACGGRTVSVSLEAAGTSTTIRIGMTAGQTSTVTIAAVRMYPATRINSLAEIVRFAGITRGSLTTGDIDISALAAIDTAAGYAIGWHSLGGEVRGIDLVNLAAQSFGCAIFQDANGDLVPVLLDEPAVSADFDLDELDITEITYEADTAPGLSTKMNYGRNYAPHSKDDVAGIAATSTANELLRSELQQDVLTVTTTETLDAIYSDADDRPPLDSILSEQADAQAEIDRICALYTVPRAFYTVRAFVQAATAHTIEPGDTVQVTHSRYGLSGGVNLLVVAARSDFLGNAVDLVLWG